MNTKEKGNKGESRARDWLEAKGYTILETNYRCKLGEIDIIAALNDTIVFVEVKARRNSGSGYGEEAVSFYKQKKICMTADHYRMKKGLDDSHSFRFDVIAINSGDITHYENAFYYCGRGS